MIIHGNGKHPMKLTEGTDLLHRFEPPWRVAFQLMGGETLSRALFNLAVSRFVIEGTVLDLGCKNGASSYHSYLKFEEGCRKIFGDLFPSPGVTVVDVEKPFPFAEAEFNNVLAFHLFEHVRGWEKAVSEIYRILRPGGRVLIAVPFLHEYHPDPGDYNRLTDEALRWACEERGFLTVQVEAIGEGIATFAATKLVSEVLPSFLRPAGRTASYLATTLVDRIVALRPRIRGRTVPMRFALEYLAVFQKPSRPV